LGGFTYVGVGERGYMTPSRPLPALPPGLPVWGGRGGRGGGDCMCALARKRERERAGETGIQRERSHDTIERGDMTRKRKREVT